MQPYPYGGGMQPQDQQDLKNMQELCKKHIMHLLQFETMDGHVFPGIVENVDDDGVDVLVPDGDNYDDNDYDYNYDNNYQHRQYWYGGGFGFYPYGFPPFWQGYPFRFRRFRRRRFPFRILRRIFFPYFY